MDDKNNVTETMRERFDKKGFSPTAYAKAYGVSRDVLYRVLDGKLTGVKKSHENGGNTRKVIAQLKKDGIWIGRLPWEV